MPGFKNIATRKHFNNGLKMNSTFSCMLGWRNLLNYCDFPSHPMTTKEHRVESLLQPSLNPTDIWSHDEIQISCTCRRFGDVNTRYAACARTKDQKARRRASPTFFTGPAPLSINYQDHECNFGATSKYSRIEGG